MVLDMQMHVVHVCNAVRARGGCANSRWVRPTLN
jgi:hypothetical protein